MAGKAKLGVWKFASCDGCQLSLLDCEDELLAVAEAVEISYFLEATRQFDDSGPFDLGLVEGSISTPEDMERIKSIRKKCKKLVTIGACATSGGVQALRNFADVDEFVQCVYAHPEYIETLDTSSPVSEHVPVDFELRGCPINKYELIELISATLNQRRPWIVPDAVCLDCKRQGNVCVMVAQQTPCLGPITHGGCGALCPSYHRGCYGCYGPKEKANAPSLMRWWSDAMNQSDPEILRALRTFNTNAPAFRRESKRHVSA